MLDPSPSRGASLARPSAGYQEDTLLSAFAAAFRTPDLRKKLLFTLAIIVLYRFGADRCLVGAAELAAVLRGAAGQAPPAPRVSAYFGYAPLDPAHLPRIDGVVFVRDVAPEP